MLLKLTVKSVESISHKSDVLVKAFVLVMGDARDIDSRALMVSSHWILPGASVTFRTTSPYEAELHINYHFDKCRFNFFPL